jgi:hypothetical protein
MDLNVVLTRAVTVQDMESIQILSEYKLTEKAYNEYITTIKWNEGMSYEDAKKKIIRDILLSREACPHKKFIYKRLFYYGCLQIGLNEKEKEIYYINNVLGVDYDFKLDREKRRMLNKIMGIKEGK